MRSLSLKYQLVLPFALLILLIPVGTGWMLYRSGAATVDALLERIQQETITRINETTEARLAYALSALDTFTGNRRDPSQGAVMASVDLDVLELRAWETLQQAQEAGTYVCFGGTDGRFVGIYRINGYLHEVYQRLPGENERRISAKTSAASPAALLRTDNFDPRTRPWYRSAIDRFDPVWSPVYFDFTSKLPVITVARAVRDSGGKPLGVAAVDVELRLISDVLRSLTISRNSVAFVMDGEGHIVASSEESPLPQTTTAPGQATEHPLIDAARKQVLAWREQSAHPGATLPAITATPQGAIGVAASRVGLRYGLDWTTVVVIPGTDFTARITSSFNRGLAIAVGAVFLALMFGMWLLNRLLRDIRTLNEAVVRIGRGESIPALDISRADEIGQLARSFQEMGQSLRTDKLTGAFNRDYLLNQFRLIQEFERAHGTGTRPFALLFIDLDDFKEINDRYGHDCGDIALVEIAARLKSGVRSSDIVVRYGGDEFVILLIDMASTADVQAAEEKIHALVEAPMQLGAHTVHTGISVGWSLYPAEGQDIETLTRTADARMFDAKRARKNGG